MLVLSRKQHQKIRIYDKQTKTMICEITVVESHGRTRLGVDCPDWIDIYRDEIDPITPVEDGVIGSRFATDNS